MRVHMGLRGLALLAVLGGVLALAPLREAGAQAEITPAPAFDAEDLTALPRQNWITNGGTISNPRYSPLDQIDRENVDQLKADWRTAMGSGANAGNSGQAQILVYEGVLYVSNGENDVFAMDVEDGEILWSYEGKPHPEAGNPFGRSNRGVAMGDGRIYVTQLDAKIVALDQQTGEVVWSTQGAPWQKGYSITSAPLYYEGMVITGYSGGVMGARGRVDAFDAETGERVWRFNTVPGPDEFGHDTWPQDNDAWTRGGAPVWQTPAVDPELGLIYFSTGNPAPVLNGSIRAGDNLFANSIVALDARTGEYRWHFQEIHHDIWDYDAANPIVLFEAEIDGQRRKGLVQVGKTGWAYILDRETGEPLIGIEERPVPQEPRQATAKTQPHPVGDPIVPQHIEIPPEGANLDPETRDLPNQGRIFTPFWTEEVTLKPHPQGGANWPPSSFDPTTNTLYVCATDRMATYQVDLPLEEPVDNRPYFGGSLGQAEGADRGIFAALDVTTNRIKWRRQWREPCYSGSVVTKSGLLFVGRSDGRLTALDKRDGETLWEFQTDAGVNTTVTSFMHEGDQHIVVHAGGGVFANGKRGDSIWMFSLEGSIGPVDADETAETPGGPPPEAENGEPETDASRDEAAGPGPDAEEASEDSFDLERGQRLYAQTCVACHGPDGQGGQGGGAPFTEDLSRSRIISATRNGGERMPAFGSQFSEAELRDIAHYIREDLIPEN